MRLWQKAVGAIKDHNSIWQANLSRRTVRRNPEIEKAVIRSTTHYILSLDRRNVDRVYQWILISPYNLSPVLAAVSHRICRSRDWIVALKSLHLMHNVVNSKLHCVRRIRHLPFNLSAFNVHHASPAKSWPFNAFVRAYYAFLDRKLEFICQQGDDNDDLSIMTELVNLQKQQALIDLLIQIRPQSHAASVPIILDVMDGIIIEIYDIYGRICRGIAIVLMNIYSSGKAEVIMALEVVKKATQQGEDLAYYFEFCHNLGCFHTTEFPIVDKIPEEGIRELEQIIRGFDECEDKAIIVVEDGNGYEYEYENLVVEDVSSSGYGYEMKDHLYKEELKTVITDKWERFDDEGNQQFDPTNPFTSPLLLLEYEQCGKNQELGKIQELPDLIIF